MLGRLRIRDERMDRSEHSPHHIEVALVHAQIEQRDALGRDHIGGAGDPARGAGHEPVERENG